MTNSVIRKSKDMLMTSVLYAVAIFIWIVIICGGAFLFQNGWEAVSLDFLIEAPRDGMTAGGIFTPLVGTIQLIIVSMAVSVPIGIITGIYFAEYAKDGGLTNILRISVRSLAGVPSIIFGLFGLSLFVVFMRLGSCLLSAGLTLACLSLPLIITVSEQALKAVPQDYRDASYALGATKSQTILKVVLPSAGSTIITGAILAIGRVAGETAPIMFTGAAYYAPDVARSLFSQVMALPYHIYVLATSSTDLEAARPIEYGAILVLIAFVLGISGMGIIARRKLNSRGVR